MKLKIKDVNIASGGPPIAILNESDAEKLDLHHEDRVALIKGKRKAIAIIDIAVSKKAVPAGTIGLFEEVLRKLKAKSGEFVTLQLENKPLSVQFIKQKLDGKHLDYKELREIVRDIVNERLDSIELTYFVSAGYMKHLAIDEVISLIKAMVSTGEVLRLNRKVVVDKHSIGGVPGNRTTMIIVPIVTAAGLTMPKTSSRAITSPAGTADTMEVLAPVNLPLKKFKRVVEKVGGAIIWGGALNLAPADDKIIRVESPLRIDAEGQLLASVMAKKLSVGSTHVLIDIPMGKHVKCKTRAEAEHLRRDFETVGRKIGMKVRTTITNGSQPIGKGIGPALEARDVLYVLTNDKRAPQDLKTKSLELAGMILEMGGKAKRGKGKALAQSILESGLAYKKMKEIIRAQGGNKVGPAQIKIGRLSKNINAPRSGTIKEINAEVIAKAARLAGAPKDAGAGIYLHKHVGDRIKPGEELFTVYAQSRQKLEYAVSYVKENDAYVVK